MIKELSFQVASADQSYMPQRVVVSGGRDEINLRELNDVRIPRYCSTITLKFVYSSYRMSSLPIFLILINSIFLQSCYRKCCSLRKCQDAVPR